MAVGYGRRVRRLVVDFVAGKAPSPPTAWYVGLALSSTNPADDASGLAAGEPTIGTGAYARSTSIGTTSANWTAAPLPAADASTISANAVAVAFTASSAAWSTGAGVLGFFFLSDSTTLQTEATYIGRGSFTPTTAVNASGITLSFAIGQLSMTAIST